LRDIKRHFSIHVQDASDVERKAVAFLACGDAFVACGAIIVAACEPLATDG
jgi:hypothetical protein